MPVRVLPLFVSVWLAGLLYWGLNQAESRAIYAAWDVWLHAAVFFLIWWLARLSLRLHWLWVTLMVVAMGAAEEVHQMWLVDHVASWSDWLADVAGAGLALALYLSGRGLHAMQSGLARPEPDASVEGAGRVTAVHAADWRWTLRFGRWEYYVVLLAGRNHRALSPSARRLARLTLGLVMLGFVLFAGAVSVSALYLVKVALGV